MKHINLIPWRAQAREYRKREFLNILAAAMFASILLLALFHFILTNALRNQESINNIYSQEINKLNQQLTVIGQLKKQQQAIVERISIIDKLQANRSQTVNIFSDMVKALPQGIYLTSIRRVEDIITITGKAESNTRVSMFMRNLEALSWLAQAALSQIQANPTATVYTNDFVLQITLKPLQGVNDNKNKTAVTKSKQDNKTNKTQPTTKQ